MKKILVVEDEPHNQEAARILLQDHELTIREDFNSAMNELTEGGYSRGGEQKFDVMLTDVSMHERRVRCPITGEWCYEELPLGYALILVAAKEGVPLIGVVSDAVLKFFARDKANGYQGPPIRVEDSTCRFFLDDSLPLLFMRDGRLQEGFNWDDYDEHPERYESYPKRSKSRSGMPIFYRNWLGAFNKLVDGSLPSDVFERTGNPLPKIYR